MQVIKGHNNRTAQNDTSSTEAHPSKQSWEPLQSPMPFEPPLPASSHTVDHGKSLQSSAPAKAPAPMSAVSDTEGPGNSASIVDINLPLQPSAVGGTDDGLSEVAKLEIGMELNMHPVAAPLLIPAAAAVNESTAMTAEAVVGQQADALVNFPEGKDCGPMQADDAVKLQALGFDVSGLEAPATSAETATRRQVKRVRDVFWLRIGRVWKGLRKPRR